MDHQTLTSTPNRGLQERNCPQQAGGGQPAQGPCRHVCLCMHVQEVTRVSSRPIPKSHWGWGSSGCLLSRGASLSLAQTQNLPISVPTLCPRESPLYSIHCKVHRPRLSAPSDFILGGLSLTPAPGLQSSLWRPWGLQGVRGLSRTQAQSWRHQPARTSSQKASSPRQAVGSPVQGCSLHWAGAGGQASPPGYNHLCSKDRTEMTSCQAENLSPKVLGTPPVMLHSP